MITNFFEACVLRQLAAIAISGWLSLTSGFAYGFSAVLLPDLKKDENFHYDDNLASWIASITPLSMIISCICAGSIIDRFGRKVGHIIQAVISIISWVIIALATNGSLLLIGRFVVGLSIGASRPVSLVYLGEITSPKYRSVSLVCSSLSISMGVILGHVIGNYVSWKMSSYIYIAANILCLVSSLMLKETPLWLISKGKIDEGVKSFIRFRGSESEAEAELKLVLERHNEKIEKKVINDIFSRGFMKAFFTGILLAIVTQFNGVNTITFYAKDILGNTVKSKIDPFLLMIIFDMIRLMNFILVLFCNKFIPRKILFLGVCVCCSVALFGIAVVSSVSGNVWLMIMFIIVYTLSGSSVVILAWTFVPEMFGGSLRGLGSGIIAAISFLLLFICVKITPSFITNYGVIYMYSCFGGIVIVTTIILYFLLPETNDRTLQDIEDTYNKNNIVI